jgi:Lhr-like helicase
MNKEQNKFGHLIDEATKTPRTDKAAFVANFSGTVFEVVDADFARQLEIELADAKAKLKKLREKK